VADAGLVAHDFSLGSDAAIASLTIVWASSRIRIVFSQVAICLSCGSPGPTGREFYPAAPSAVRRLGTYTNKQGHSIQVPIQLAGNLSGYRFA
jgi:hypothetical protein